MKQKILIVEDEYVEANYLEIFLEKDGYHTVGLARSVPAALRLLDEKQPQLVLVDIFLQGDQTGIELGYILKQRGIPFLYTSANSNKNTLAAAKQTEPYGFLVKPYREKDVLVMVEIAFYLHEQKLKLRDNGSRPEAGTGTDLLHKRKSSALSGAALV